MKKAVEILDDMIQAMPSGVSSSAFQFVVSSKIHGMLRTELNRNVKTYKGYKVKSFTMVADGVAYLAHKTTVKNLYL